MSHREMEFNRFAFLSYNLYRALWSFRFRRSGYPNSSMNLQYTPFFRRLTLLAYICEPDRSFDWNSLPFEYVP